MGRRIIGKIIREPECIVYLYTYSKAGDGIVDAFIDFRQLKDLVRFRRITELFENSGTIIELRSLKSAKRLMRGCYYKLNLTQLKNFAFTRNENSLLIGGSYDLSKMKMPTDDDTELLQQHEPLEPEELRHRNVPQELPVLFSATNDMKLFVKDVDQANWNELRCGNKIVVLFDAGAKLHAAKSDVEAIFDSRSRDLEQSKPILVLSHWDMDHIHCLKLISQKDIPRYFSKLICVDKMQSITAEDVYDKFLKSLGKKNVYCVSPAARTNGVDMHLWKDMGCISLYMGEQSRNINYCGIAMFVKGTQKSGNYTGDCRLSQAKSVYDQEIQKGISTNKHILIAPHHGGDYGATYRHYSQPCNHIAISVGANNGYGHPNEYMLRYLNSLCFRSIWRTDDKGNYLVDL